MQGHALIFGNGFAWIERAGPMNTGKPVAMWIMDPQQMLVRYVDGELWYCTVIGGEQKKFPGRDVLHIAGLSHDGIVGYSALDTFHEALGLGIAAQQFGSRFFGQGGNMGGLLMCPGHYSEEQIRNTVSAWGQMNEGMKNSHKVALLQDGTKFIPTTVDPNAGQFNETRDFEVRAVVANILGVPPHLLGDATRTSHNSLESENQSFLDHSLRPWLDTWEDELERKLLSEREQERGTHFIEFNAEAAVKMEFEKKVNGIAKQVEIGMLTVNESRKLLNMPDVGEDGDKRYHPANWLEVGEEPEAMPEQSPAEPDEDDAEETDATADTLRAVLHSNVSEAVNFEKRKVITAAKTTVNFPKWLDKFYSGWCQTTVPVIDSDPATLLKQQYAAESKRQLLNAIETSMPATMAANVKDVTDTWDERAVTLTTDLMETVK
jgi:HK97 family phage portal protein